QSPRGRSAGSACHRGDTKVLMKRLLAWLGGLTVWLAVLLCAAQLIGRANENPLAALLSDTRTQSGQACWQAICLGQTTLAQAKTILAKNSDRTFLGQTSDMNCWNLTSISGWQSCLTRWGSTAQEPVE